MVDDNEAEGTVFEDGDVQGTTVDLSGVEESAGFEIVPKGIYEVAVSDATYKVASKTGAPMILLTLEIVEGDYAGRKLFTNLVFSPKAQPIVKTQMRVLGMDHLLTGPFDVEQSAPEFIGSKARAVVDIQKYEGNDTNRVKQLRPSAEGNGNAFLADE